MHKKEVLIKLKSNMEAIKQLWMWQRAIWYNPFIKMVAVKYANYTKQSVALLTFVSG